MSLEEYVMIGSATNPIAMNADICLTDIEHIAKSSAETIIAKKWVKSFQNLNPHASFCSCLFVMPQKKLPLQSILEG
jgi:hypothetical protein